MPLLASDQLLPLSPLSELDLDLVYLDYSLGSSREQQQILCLDL